MKLLKLIANLGYGSRREVARMFDQGLIRDANGQLLGEKTEVQLANNAPALVTAGDSSQAPAKVGNKLAYDQIRIDKMPLDPAPGSVWLMHKPLGYTCSTRDPNQVIYDLLPARYRLRDPIVAPVGRLDRQTSGLLLLTDDGALQHRITAPRQHLTKVYRAQLAQPLRGDEAAIFASGSLMLDGEDTPLKPATLKQISAVEVEISLSEGRYHQVRRMFAAVGNHVQQLERTAIGQLHLYALPSGPLLVGQTRLLTAEELALVFAVQK